MGYDEDYAAAPDLFGAEPDAILLRFVHHLPAGGRVLDVGAGQGRHAFPLARRGFAVTALEPSPTAAAALRAGGVGLDVVCSRFEDYDTQGCDGVLVFGLYPDLDCEDIAALVARIGRWLRPGGVLWSTGFTTDDPAYARIAREWEALGRHSFRGPGGRVRTYLEPGGILDLHPGWKVLHHWEGLGPWHRHGDGPAERHGRFEAVLVRPASA